MTDQELDAIRRMIAAGMGNATIRDMLDIFGAIKSPEHVPSHPGVLQSHPRTVGMVAHRRPAQSPSYARPDTTRTMYRLSPIGAHMIKRNPGGNIGVIVEHYAATKNAWTDSRAMRSAGVLAHGEHDNKNKALESAIHGMVTAGLFEKRRKPSMATAPRGTEI